jgi:hypothetical protein
VTDDDVEFVADVLTRFTPKVAVDH